MTRRTPVALLLGGALLAGCGGGEDEPSEPRVARDPFAEVTRERATSDTTVRAAPRWERLTTLRGDGTARRSLDVSARAIQWRADWTCRRGALRLTARPAGRPQAQVLDARCPASGEATAVSTGPLQLSVTADGPWRLVVDQQVDTPLREPPLPSMRDARRVGAGRFYGLDRRGRGTARLLRLADGRLALRFEGFETAASADLFVWVSRDRRPRSSREALDSRHVEVAPLRATAGSQNYVLPRRLTRADVRSVVIWCEPVRIAYAAASLG